MDQAIIEAWQPIRDGNCDDAQQTINRYTQKYGKWIMKAKPFKTEDLIGEDLIFAARQSNNSGAGADGMSGDL